MAALSEDDHDCVGKPINTLGRIPRTWASVPPDSSKSHVHEKLKAADILTIPLTEMATHLLQYMLTDLWPCVKAPSPSPGIWAPGRRRMPSGYSRLSEPGPSSLPDFMCMLLMGGVDLFTSSRHLASLVHRSPSLMGPCVVRTHFLSSAL